MCGLGRDVISRIARKEILGDRILSLRDQRLLHGPRLLGDLGLRRDVGFMRRLEGWHGRWYSARPLRLYQKTS
jgi:hypothetical protein